jgi:hypothetical protein
MAYKSKPPQCIKFIREMKPSDDGPQRGKSTHQYPSEKPVEFLSGSDEVFPETGEHIFPSFKRLPGDWNVKLGYPLT